MIVVEKSCESTNFLIKYAVQHCDLTKRRYGYVSIQKSGKVFRRIVFVVVVRCPLCNA